jgi:hypothetical protein
MQVRPANFRTEAPYVVAAKSSVRKSHHYSAETAVEAIKAEAKGVRHVYGMHRGDWRLLATYQDGVRQ